MINYSKKYIFVVLLLICLSAGISAQSNNKILEQAKTSIEKKEYDVAIKDLTSIISVEPKNDEAYAQRSRAYYLRSYLRNDLNNALADAENSLKLNSKNVIALNIRGLIKLEQKDIDGALADFTKAINIDPSYVKAYLNRTRILRARKQFDEALADFNAAIKIDPKSGYAYLNRGLVYLWDKREYRNAVDDFSKAIELDPKDKESYVRRADGYLQLNNYQSSFSDANKALEIAPDYAAAYYVRGLVFENQPKPDFAAAIADFTKTIELKDPVLMSEAYRKRAHLHNSFDKDYAAAISDATESIKLNPNMTNSFEERGYAEMQLKKFAEAETDYRQATKMNPANPYNFAFLSYINDNLNRVDQAIADARQALVLDPNHELAKKNLAALLAKQPPVKDPPVKTVVEEQTNDQKVASLLDYAAYNLLFGVQELARGKEAVRTKQSYTSCGYVKKAKEYLRAANFQLDTAESIRTIRNYSASIAEYRRQAAALRDVMPQGCF
jgi:tetratricopeptide (TPR) repeat protein